VDSDQPDPTRPPKRGPTVWKLLLIGITIGIVALAIMELRTRGTAGVGSIGVADYRAHAETQAGSAPGFTLPSLDGNGSISLSSFRGKALVLNFFASWCGPCRLEAPGFRKIANEYADRGVQFLGVDYRDNDAAGLAFMDGFGLGYPAVADHAGSLADDYDLLGMPTTFVIDAQGIIRYRFIGYVQEQSLRDALDALLEGGHS
jgi:cytochrome c biogenesis protein CcmG, thiol:disulfide interchange protein DsbE